VHGRKNADVIEEQTTDATASLRIILTIVISSQKEVVFDA